jgi:5'-deoxynucleotidase YfbR-like HD superfamily hydrolase
MTKTKKQREAKAIIDLEKVLWEKDFADFKTLILEYENKSSIEAEFVYELDKLQPMIKVIMAGWWDYHRLKMDKNKIMKNKLEKITDKFWFRQILRRYEKIGDENNMFYFNK